MRINRQQAVGVGAIDVQPTNSVAGGSAASILPEPMTLAGGSLSYQALAELLARADQSDRREARTTERIADQAQAQADESRYEQMMAKAEDDRANAFATGLGEMVGGIATGASACFNGTTQQILTGAGKAAPGAGSMIASGHKAAADHDDADAAKYEAQSRADERLSKEAHEEVQDARDALKKVADFLKDLQQGTNSALQTAAAFRA